MDRRIITPSLGTFIALWLLFCLTLVPAEALDSAEVELVELRANFEKLEAASRSSQGKLDTRYEEELDKLMKAATAAGNLKLGLATRGETKRFREAGGVEEISDQPGIAKLQKIYVAQTAKLAKQQAAKSLKNKKTYSEWLAKLATELAKAGDVNAALDVRVEQEKIERIIADAKPDEPEPSTEPKLARYLRLELGGEEDRVLNLTEVEVISGGENIAPRGKASQSSTSFKYGQSPTADRAIDGNTDGDFMKAKSTTHTEEEQNPWWELNLRKNVEVSQIVIWNREGKWLWKRLNGLQVTLLDKHKKVIWKTEIEEATQINMTLEVGEK